MTVVLQKIKVLSIQQKKCYIPCITWLQNLYYRNIRCYGRFTSYSKTQAARAVSEAERLVGYPSSFLSLRHLLTDEVSNVAVNMKKLLGGRHPLIRTIRGFIHNDSNSGKAKPALIVLLIAKAAGRSQCGKPEPVDEIYPSQRSLAEITEMIHMAQMIHTGIVNLPDSVNDDDDKNLQLGNKMAVLIGDFLLAKASTGLAKLDDTQVVELMSEAISEMMEGEFLPSTVHDMVKSNTTNCIDLWKQRTYLKHGSLLAKSCQSALRLVNHESELESAAYNFGRNLAYTQQLSLELQTIQKDDTGAQVDYMSLPTLLAFQKDQDVPTLLSSNIQLYLGQLKVIEEAKRMCHEYQSETVKCLQHFQSHPAKAALEKIVLSTVDRFK